MIWRLARFKRQFSVFKTIRTAQPLLVWNEDEAMIKEAVNSFSKQIIAPKVLDMDKNQKLDKEIISNLFEQGFMAVDVPSDYGGVGSTFTCTAIVIEELAKVDASVSVFCDVQNTLVNANLLKFGTPDLKHKYLPRLCSDTVGCFCLSESSSGSDAFSLKTAAKKVDKGYILNGSKMWITNGAEAEIFIVFANIDRTLGYKGITAFVVEKDWGVKIAKKEIKTGIRASSTCGLSFDDVFVPEENILGELGKGYKIAIDTLNLGRIGIAAQMTGIAQGAFNQAVNYILNDRKQFDKYVGEFQGMEFQYAQAATKIEAARLLTFNAARLKDAGQSFILQAAQAKLFSSQVAQSVTSQAIDWMGGVGFTPETLVEKYWRDSKIGTIYEGTSNMQLQTIAKLISSNFKS